MNTQIRSMCGLSMSSTELVYLSSLQSKVFTGASLGNERSPGGCCSARSPISRGENLARRSRASSWSVAARNQHDQPSTNFSTGSDLSAELSREQMRPQTTRRRASAEFAQHTFQRDSLEAIRDVHIVSPTRSGPDWWPEKGSPVDLSVHDLPHDSATLEWWYVNSHLTAKDGRQFSLFASFFRIADTDQKTGEILKHTHSITWAITDVSKKTYTTETLLDPSAPKTAVRHLEEVDPHGGQIDPLLHRALLELYRKGVVPLPDRLMDRDATVSQGRLELDYDGNRFEKTSDGRYRLTLLSRDETLGAELIFDPQTPPIRHGEGGVIKSGPKDEGMFYYFMPRCDVEGRLIVDGRIEGVREGSGWYDHEFGRTSLQSSSMEDSVAWNWFSAQLSNGYQVTVADLFDPYNVSVSRKTASYAVLVDPTGRAKTYHDAFKLEPVVLDGSTWTSTRTFVEYPVMWEVSIPTANLCLQAEAVDQPAQEYITSLNQPAFWEGRVNVSGTCGGHVVAGLGFVERAGFGRMATLPEFFKAVSKETQKTIRKLLPLPLTEQDLLRLVGDETNAHYIAGVDRDQYASTVIKPIRDVIDGIGKCWRSYASVASIDVVGGNSDPYRDQLAYAEVMHVGSLITDDVQDRSAVRRGRPTCHEVYGEPLAINAGSACYFLAHLVQNGVEHLASDELKVRMYEMFFATMRAAHAGQAIDIDGFETMMPAVVEQGAWAAQELERRVLGVHLLKSGAPCASLGRAGAEKGGGTADQMEGIGNFYESIGVAFQVIDDVLNLRGFEGDLKGKGEDIACGKITMPVAKAMSRLSRSERRSIWETIRSRPIDPVMINSVIQKLEDCGAIQACHDQAVEIIESAWRRLDPLVPDSDVKIRLRAFGWYVLDRHY